VAAGRSIAAQSGTEPQGFSMELGGSDAFIVLEDADWKKQFRGQSGEECINAGQTCCAAKRFIVVEEIADKFLEKFKTALKP
jgi:succinate-semialdehyde dehydrogenase / glutarate-semialdehyde dehydrogenase